MLITPAAVEPLPAVKHWLSHAEATRRILKENYPQLEGDARLTAAVEENVLVQLENLKTHPAVAAGIGRGEVFAHVPDQGRFLPLAEAPMPAAKSPERRLGTASI